MQTPNLSSDAVQSGMRNAITMTRDNLLAASDYQLETLRLLQRQGNELQKVIADLLDEHQSGSLEERTARVGRFPPRRVA